MDMLVKSTHFHKCNDALQNSEIAGSVASAALSTLFAIALLASGQIQPLQAH